MNDSYRPSEKVAGMTVLMPMTGGMLAALANLLEDFHSEEVVARLPDYPYTEVSEVHTILRDRAANALLMLQCQAEGG